MPTVATPHKDRPYEWVIDDLKFRLADMDLLKGADPHSIEPISFLPPQYNTAAELSLGDVNREAEIPQAQDDFSGGFSKDRRYSEATKNKFLWSKGVDTTVPSVGLLPGPVIQTIGAPIAYQPLKAVQKGSITYLAAGRGLYQITNATTITLDVDFGAGNDIKDILLLDDKIVLAFGSTGLDVRYRVSDTIAAAFTALTGIKAAFLAVVQDIIWRATDFKVFSADNINGPWAPYDIGDTAYSITSLVPVREQIHVGKQDGPWILETDGSATALLPEIRQQAYAYVCWNAFNWHGEYVFSTRHSTLHLSIPSSFKPSNITSIGLDEMADAAPPGNEFRPDVFATDGRYLYGLVSQVVNPTPINGIFIYKWDHELNMHNYLWRDDLPGKSALFLFITARIGADDFKNAVMFSYQTVATTWQVAWSRYPSVANPLKDSAYQFDNVHQSSLRTLDYTVNLPTVKKVTDRMKMVADSISMAAPVEVWTTEDNAALRQVVTFKIAPDEEKRLLRPLEYHRIALEIRMTAGSQSDTTLIQKVRGIHMPAVYLSRVVRKHTVQLMAIDNEPLATGGRRAPREGTFLNTIDSLRELRRTKAAVSCTDEDGRKFEAYLGDISEHTLAKRQGTAFDPVKVLTVILHEVEF